MELERYRRITDGFAVYLPNKQSKTYWCRVRILKKEIKKTTNEREIDKAIERAYMIKAHLQNRVEKDLPVTSSKTINAISESFLEYVDQTQAPSTIIPLKRYFKRYLMVDWVNSPVDEIKASDILKLYDAHGLHGTKIGKYTEILLKRLFDYLEYNEFISKENRPTIPKPKPKETESFELLTVDELKAFADFFELTYLSFMNQYEVDKSQKNLALLERHSLANMYYYLLSGTGARPGDELLNLKFKDLIREDRKNFNDIADPSPYVSSFNIRINSGKMSKRKGSREIPTPREFENHMFRYTRHIFDGFHYDYIKKNPEKYVFGFGDKTKINKDFYEKTFNLARESLIKNKKIRKDVKIVPYSFRHTYITFALVQRIDVYLLAENCGNSVNVIQKTYSKLAASMRAEEIYKIDLFKDLE
jgi:integrase